MKLSKPKIPFIPLIYGVVVTLFMLLIFGSALILAFIDNWPDELRVTLNALTKWYDDPTGFFFNYLIGYGIIWWKKLAGSIIIMLGSIMVTIINIDNIGFLIFAVPAFLVGFFYLENWYRKDRSRKASSL